MERESDGMAEGERGDGLEFCGDAVVELWAAVCAGIRLGVDGEE